MGIQDELRSRNFSLYAQWLGVLSIVLGLALGIANIFHFNLLILWSVILLCCALVLIFVEIPLLLRICPTSAKFDAIIRTITTNYMRGGMYAGMGIFQILSAAYDPSSLIAAGVVMLLTATCYLIAGLKNQDFVASKALGGQGVAQMIV